MTKRNSSLKKSRHPARNRELQDDAEMPTDIESSSDKIEIKAERKNTRPWGWAVSAILIVGSITIIGYAGYLIWTM